MSDLRTMSDVAPLADIVISVAALLIAILVANLMVIPAFSARDARRARIMATVSGVGIGGLVLVLGFHPRSLYAAGLGYTDVAAPEHILHVKQGH